MQSVLTNTIKGTSITVRVKNCNEHKYSEPFGYLSPRQIKNIRRTLCPDGDFEGFGVLGTYGAQPCLIGTYNISDGLIKISHPGFLGHDFNEIKNPRFYAKIQRALSAMDDL